MKLGSRGENSVRGVGGEGSDRGRHPGHRGMDVQESGGRGGSLGSGRKSLECVRGERGWENSLHFGGCRSALSFSRSCGEDRVGVLVGGGYGGVGGG